jgi:hypothetical protein
MVNGSRDDVSGPTETAVVPDQLESADKIVAFGRTGGQEFR